MIRVENVTPDRNGGRLIALCIFWRQHRRAVTASWGWKIDGTGSKAREIVRRRLKSRSKPQKNDLGESR